MNIKSNYVEIPQNPKNKEGKQYKDINEWYCNTQKETFCDELEQSIYDKYTKRTIDYYLGNYLEEIKNYCTYPIKKTGFSLLDECLDGGIRQGLYVIGAIPSLRQDNIYFANCR